ncbi:MAG: hypothetical protein IIA87_00250 [Nanoarchaeota archaeon]|nr:hypothetical protein [Nanoarchaeota archaeon]
MQVIGFNFTKISAERVLDFKKSKVDIDIQFTNIEKEKIDLLKDSEALKVTFKHILNYNAEDEKDPKQGEIAFEGHLVLTVTKDESKEIMKTWKKKTLPNNITLLISNLILKRCASRAFQLQDELGLPSHIRVPRLGPREQ